MCACARTHTHTHFQRRGSEYAPSNGGGDSGILQLLNPRSSSETNYLCINPFIELPGYYTLISLLAGSSFNGGEKNLLNFRN